MTFFPDERASELRDLFFESAEEMLQAMNEAGLALEERPDDEESCAACVAPCTRSRAIRRLAAIAN